MPLSNLGNNVKMNFKTGTKNGTKSVYQGYRGESSDDIDTNKAPFEAEHQRKMSRAIN